MPTISNQASRRRHRLRRLLWHPLHLERFACGSAAFDGRCSIEHRRGICGRLDRRENADDLVASRDLPGLPEEEPGELADAADAPWPVEVLLVLASGFGSRLRFTGMDGRVGLETDEVRRKNRGRYGGHGGLCCMIERRLLHV